MRAIHVNVRVAAVRGALSHGDYERTAPITVLYSFIHSFTHTRHIYGVMYVPPTESSLGTSTLTVGLRNKFDLPRTYYIPTR